MQITPTSTTMTLSFETNLFNQRASRSIATWIFKKTSTGIAFWLLVFTKNRYYPHQRHIFREFPTNQIQLKSKNNSDFPLKSNVDIKNSYLIFAKFSSRQSKYQEFSRKKNYFLFQVQNIPHFRQPRPRSSLEAQ